MGSNSRIFVYTHDRMMKLLDSVVEHKIASIHIYLNKTSLVSENKFMVEAVYASTDAETARIQHDLVARGLAELHEFVAMMVHNNVQHYMCRINFVNGSVDISKSYKQKPVLSDKEPEETPSETAVRNLKELSTALTAMGIMSMKTGLYERIQKKYKSVSVEQALAVLSGITDGAVKYVQEHTPPDPGCVSLQ